jgi:23S rRNA (uracil-5-)-methyltransferase RumA
LKKNDIVTLKIEKNKYPGIGIGFLEDKKVHVKQTITGQTVSVRLGKKRSERFDARLLEVIENSPLEQASFCEHFGSCGGCAFQTLSAEGQLNLKRDMVACLFDEAKASLPITNVIESPSVFEYRNKMEYSFGDEYQGGPLTLGMHKKGRHHDVVNIPSCHLTDVDYKTITVAILDYFTRLGAPKFNKREETGFLKHLVVRKSKGTGEIMVALSATTQYDFDTDAFKVMLLALPLKGELVSIIYVKNDGKSDMVSGPYDVLHGRDYIVEKLYGLTFKVSLYSFFQTNTEGAELLYKTALDLIPDMNNKVCLDLFSGTGTIGQIMAKHAKSVIGIELVKDAVDAANENAKLNGIDNCTFLCGDVYKVLNTLDVTPEVIVVDPPRAGIGEKAVQKISSYEVPEIVYISCNPKSLLDDLAWFRREGYTADGMQLVDMFPWTGHVETVVKLQRQNP